MFRGRRRHQRTDRFQPNNVMGGPLGQVGGPDLFLVPRLPYAPLPREGGGWAKSGLVFEGKGYIVSLTFSLVLVSR